MRRPPRVIFVLVALNLLMGALAVGNYVVASALGVERTTFFRLGMESNLPSWYSASQLLLVAGLFGLIAWRDVKWRSPRTWAAATPALFFLLLSLDEGGMVHERIGWWVEAQSGLGEDLLTGPWLLLAVPFYAVLSVLVFRAMVPYLRGRPLVVRLGLAGGALFVIAAAGFEGLGNFTDPDDPFARQVLGVFEEVGEMMAATLFVWCALELIRAEGFHLVMRSGPTEAEPEAPGA
ncbi:MAG: hypothetical protein AAF791_00930 [Bacteroidota bacterium]